MITSTRTHVTYFSRDDVKVLHEEVARLSRDLARRSGHMDGAHALDALDRIAAVRLAVKRLTDICPD